MLNAPMPQEVFDKQDEQSYKKRFPLGKNVKKALKDYLRDYKGHGTRPLFPTPKPVKQQLRDQWQSKLR
ncbi:hypothetical protein [Calidifontibacillus erzurumensis]|uniref:Uncharacterized protein n=1 Tax=Calidifontibacillus erzurumensis TaxID=2741433 RepID=A0A8J8GE09_9BACI|nr:hypothetical protein [Calidifontibacillus erzurumensis]NSL50658.1 hypothetical protein [Calidifontibacillus erzurumensis]